MSDSTNVQNPVTIMSGIRINKLENQLFSDRDRVTVVLYAEWRLKMIIM